MARGVSLGEGVTIIPAEIAAASRDLDGSDLDVLLVYPPGASAKQVLDMMKEARAMYELHLQARGKLPAKETEA